MTEAKTSQTSLKRWHITPRQFRVLAITACFFIAAIIVTGASVRVTGSGLGCPTWPKCTSDSLVPKNVQSHHSLVEFGNRVFTGLLSLSVIVAVAASMLRMPRSKTLVWLSWALVGGVLAQIVLGGITVLVGLHPMSVASHMLVSCVLLSFAVILAVVSKWEPTPSLRPLLNFDRNLLILALTSLVVILGTVVTAAGPHAGDDETPRLNVSIVSVARIHSLSAWLLLGAVCYLIFIKQDKARSLVALLGLILIQGAWGYAQYALEVPAWMVLVHVFFATLLFITSNVYWVGGRTFQKE